MKGFILIESLVSAGLIAFVGLFLFGLLNICAVNSQKLPSKFSDILDAQSKMEDLRTVSFSALSSSGNIVVTDLDPNTKSVELKSGGFALYTVRSRF